MKKIGTYFMVFFFCVGMSSCFTLTYDVGKGAQSGVTTTAKNHYLINGLVPLGTSNPTEMAKGASDYTVQVQHSFIDGLISAITFGLYAPTTTSVTR